MIKILTSNLGNYRTENGIKVALPINNDNGLVDQIKCSLNSTYRVVYIASDYEYNTKTNEYAMLFFNSLRLSGIDFMQQIIIDSEYIKKPEYVFDWIRKADLVFLCGGNTYKQHLFFEKIKLKEALKDYSGIIIGQSAGSINMANSVFNSPEKKENYEPIFFDGLDLTDINVEPHFVKDISDFNDDEIFKYNSILEESYYRLIYGQCDGSHIYINEFNRIIICGETYLIKDGNISKICDKGKVLRNDEVIKKYIKKM